MGKHIRSALVLSMLALAGSASATVIDEYLGVPSQPGNSIPGKFLITPSVPVWAFGVGNDGIQDTSISGVSSINGLDAGDHWISTLIHRDSWTDADGDGVGYDFSTGIRPIGATPPSAFWIDTTSVAWQWGSAEYVAYYWLYNRAGDPDAVLAPGIQYDAFNFFADSPSSPFAVWTQTSGAGGFEIASLGETVLTGPGAEPVPEPATAVLLLAGALVAAYRKP